MTKVSPHAGDGNSEEIFTSSPRIEFATSKYHTHDLAILPHNHLYTFIQIMGI